ncbi:bifunctional 5,10-methylene-tetrahydrofolate dehydrogenase/5,10-methylene-tetrahydrofolate cyclohydrolase [candidate division KSB1 bacterium 4572_119]|nr:MAG: bifunctional 5,10-methylene-tetrahydrofolate dehydrogenase/5,10-methylene-tetrahydrofolate cyclohydrolase [candidate division KSB1 bacterium 4572_119]
MKAKIIDGKLIANQIKTELIQEIEKLEIRGFTPGLATVLVGEDPASNAYVRMKEKMCDEIGIQNFGYRLSGNTTENELLKLVDDLKNDHKVHGILVQLPLPKQINEQNVINAIPVFKDVDGFHPTNWGKMMIGEESFLPCTPAGIQELLIRSGYSPENKNVVIVGRSKIVGLPLANILIQKAPGANATVTVCHSKTQNLAEHTKRADILIAAIGIPEFITADMIAENSIVIDVGVNRVEAPEKKRGYRLVGDVNFEAVAKKAKAISPVPGGVGPMTIIMLMRNTVKAMKMANKL